MYKLYFNDFADYIWLTEDEYQLIKMKQKELTIKQKIINNKKYLMT